MSTICAISTPLAEGGISVIRLSGPEALQVAAKVFVPRFPQVNVLEMQGYTCAHGDIMEDDTLLDDGVLTVFRSPRSYTGEDVCEISCHGGVYVTQRALELCLKNGAVPAQKGEFTRRALLNGKLSLTQAEAVMETIAAQEEFALASANHIRQGRLYKELTKVKDRLVTILGELAAWVDYPEEDLPEVEHDTLSRSLDMALCDLLEIERNSRNGMLLRNGIDTVIAGRPNVGKSTLMNQLLGYERSIVTDVAGTTRDVIEESARLGKLTLRLSDTAGIHETQDTVERLGVDLAKKRLEQCTLIIAVFEGDRPMDDQDRQLAKDLNSTGKKLVFVVNKSDLGTDSSWEELHSCGRPVVTISAREPGSIDELTRELEEMFRARDFSTDSVMFVNERQMSCLRRAIDGIRGASQALSGGETLDAVTVMIDQAAGALMELTGERITDSVVDEVFAKFCVGK